MNNGMPAGTQFLQPIHSEEAAIAHADDHRARPELSSRGRFPTLRDTRYPISRIANQLEFCLQTIVEKFHPARIILFGSYAYGQPDMHSDVDLLVVCEGIVSRRQSSIAVRRALYDVMTAPISFTVLCESPESLASKLAAGSHFYQEIINHGLELYAPPIASRH